MTQNAKRRVRRRRPSEESRRRLLDVGRRLAYERPVGDLLEHIRLTDVARRAGLTSGALYHYWGSQEEYQEALIDELLSSARYRMAEDVAQSLAPLIEDRVPLAEVIRKGSNADFEAFEKSPDFRVLLGFWARRDQRISDRIAHQYRDVDEDWISVMTEICDSYGLEPRPPATYELLATVLGAVLDGLVIRRAVDPEAVPIHEEPGSSDGDAADRPWHLLGIVVMALLPTLFRPKDGSDQRDLWELISEVGQS